ncbi:GHKL domain-containing protein [Bacillus sp. BGMRC 2118]|nr:GHKL domain-containing protein [Bacillus sp. BGMRC 2118]
MDKRQFSIYGKLVSYFLYSLLCAIAATGLLFIFIRQIYYYVPLPSQLNYFIVSTYADIGVLLPFLMSTILLLFFFYLMWIFKFASYFSKISDSVYLLSQGRFSDVYLPIKGKNGLGLLATYISMMQNTLTKLIEEEKKAVQSQQELVTNVSHDLRTPLTSIIGYLQLIEEDQYRDEIELRYYTSIAYEKSNRLNRMVNDLFEYTKINNHDVSLHLQDFNIIELLHQLSVQFYPEVTKKNMKIKLVSPKERIIIRADPDKLMRVFENLLSNAVKYGQEGTLIQLILQVEESTVRIKVVNHGDPIPSSALPFLFNRMYRVEQSRSDQTGGTGLGLAIAKGIINLHHGEITVSSNNTETIFQVNLPFMNQVSDE